MTWYAGGLTGNIKSIAVNYAGYRFAKLRKYRFIFSLFCFLKENLIL